MPFIALLNEWAMKQMDTRGIPRYYKQADGSIYCNPTEEPATTLSNAK